MTLEQVLEFIRANSNNEETIRAIEKATRPHILRYKASKKSELAIATAQNKAAVVVGKVSIQAKALAQFMAIEVPKRYSWYTPNIDDWAQDIEKIHMLGCEGEQRKAADRFDWATIKTVTLFSQQDPFWQQQVRSGKNLRKHFNKLLIATKAHYEKENKNKVVKI